MIEIKNLRKSFGKRVLFSIDELRLPDTGLIVLKGENGCGKTTLFNILSLMDNQFDGTLEIDGVDFKKKSDKERSLFRSKNISYVFQKNNLLSFLDSDDNEFVFENKKVHKRLNKISQFSQGQQELIALRRSLNRKAKIYFLDEVLSSLDETNRMRVKEKIAELSKKSLVLLVSHDVIVEEMASAVYEMKNGMLLEKKKEIKDEAPEFCEQSSLPDYAFLRKKSSLSFLGLHLLNFMSSIILLGMVFLGITAVRDDSLFLLASSFDDDKPICLSSNRNIDSDELLKKFDSFTYLSYSAAYPLGISDKVADDKKIHCRQETIQDYDKLNYTSGDYFNLGFKIKIPLQFDESVPRGIFLINPNTLDEYKNEHAWIQLTNFWDTKKYTCREMMNDNVRNSFLSLIDETYYKTEYKEDVPFDVQDDVFYSSSEDFESDNIQHFEVQYPNDSFQPDFNVLFPSGSKCIYDKKLQSPRSEILVSDTTLQRIKKTYRNHQSVLFITKSHHFQIASFFYFNKFSVKTYGTEIKGIERYNHINASCIPLGDYTYSFLAASSFILYLLLETGLFYYVIYVSRKDIHVLYGMGYSKNEIHDLFFSPFLISMLLSLPFGALFSFIVSWVGQAGFMSSFLFSSPAPLILFILEYFLDHLIFRSVLKNEK